MPVSHEFTCQQCNSTFAYTDAEREFRELRGLDTPTLCPSCRERDRAFRNSDLMTLYQRTETFDPFLLGDNTQGGGGGRSPRARDARATYTAICAQCAAETRVPFQPRGDRPVYCRSCFNARRGR